jgi:hypothetical protein
MLRDCRHQTHLRLLAARHTRAFSKSFAPEDRGRAGMPGASAPGASCAHGGSENAHEYSQRVHRNSPALPHAMVLTAASYSPRRSGFLASVASRILSARLDASVEASGPHDLAVRFSAARQEHVRVHRIPPRVRDDRDTPLLVGRDRDGYGSDLGRHGTEISFAMGLDSPNHTKSSPSGVVFFLTSPRLRERGRIAS